MGRFDGGRSVKDLEVLFGIYNLNYFGHLFPKSLVQRGCFFPRSSLNGQFNWLSACRRRIAKEAGYCDIDLLQ